MQSIVCNLKKYAFVLLVALLPASQAHAQTAPRLPDGEETSASGYSAWLIDPTLRYDHGVLGDAIEAGGFSVRTPGGRVLSYRLGKDAVFEDRRVRLADINGDGRPEAIVIKSYLRKGAAVAIFSIGPRGITPLVEGPAFGRSHRWLNIIGVADFNGDGRMDIAYCQTPHLSGVVRVFTFSGRALKEIGSRSGYTNHAIGSRDLDEARIVRRPNAPAEIVIPVIGRREIAVLGFRNGRLVEMSRQPK